MNIWVSQSYADPYAPGTLTIKPLNFNFSTFGIGFRQKDSQFNVPGLLLPNVSPPNATSILIRGKENAYRSPLNFGFQESDRNGIGYGAEIGYLVAQNWEIFGRAGYCHQRPNGRILFGNLSFNFKSRNNYGFAVGTRLYFDFDSKWRPFVAAALGFTQQGKAKATINAHSPYTAFSSKTDVPIGNYTLAKSKMLASFELNVGIDYAFTSNIAMTFNAGLRYNQRAGGSTFTTPATLTTYPFPFLVPATTGTYKDHKQHWYIPVTVSLKFMI